MMNVVIRPEKSMTDANRGTRASLLIRIRDADDADAWQQFSEIYSELIYRYCVKRGLQDFEARDVTQDVLQKVFQKANDFEYDPTKGTFRGWLFMTTLNQIRDRSRKNAKQARGTGRSSVHRALDAVDARQEQETWENDYRWRLFLWAAEKSKADFRDATYQAFWRVTMENQSAKQVAEKMEMTVGAVHIAKSRVMSRIREVVQQVDHESTFLDIQ